MAAWIRHLLPVAVAIALAAAGLSACSPTAADGPSDPTKPSRGASAAKPTPKGHSPTPTAPAVPLVVPGTLTVCVVDDFPPFSYVEGDELVGLDIAVAQEVADDLGVSLSTVRIPWERWGTGEDLANGGCDIAGSGQQITDAAGTAVDFSTPHFVHDFGLLVPVGSSLGSAGSLEGFTVSTFGNDPVSQNWALAQGLTVVACIGFPDAADALRSGQVDAMLSDVVVLEGVADSAFEIGVVVPGTGEVAFGVAVGNDSVRDAVNATVARVRADGTLSAIRAEYVATPPALP